METKNNNFKEFFYQATAIYKGAEAKLDEYGKEVKKYRTEWDRLKRDPNASKEDKLRTEADYEQASREYREARDGVINRANYEVALLRKELSQRSAEHYNRSVREADRDDVRLLSSGLCDINELEAVAKRCRGNVPILRMVEKCARQIPGDRSIYLIHELKKAIKEGTELENFDDLMKKGVLMLKDNNRMTSNAFTTYSRKYIQEASDVPFLQTESEGPAENEENKENPGELL